MSGLLPGWTWVPNDRSGGGTYMDGHPPRIGLHTMEGWLSTATAAAHPYPPHLWASPRTRLKIQTVPLNRSAFALYQGDGPWTNKAWTFQVEIEGFAAEAGQWPDEWLVWLAREVVVPLCEYAAEIGRPINLDHVPPIGTISGSASEHAPQRMSYADWETFDGVCSHRHVPDNDHWDTGTLNIPRLAELAKALLTRTEDDMFEDRDRATINALAKTVSGGAERAEANFRTVGHMLADPNGAVQAQFATVGRMLADLANMQRGVLDALTHGDDTSPSLDAALAQASAAQLLAALNAKVG